jgi:ATP-dependent RNA helicase DeaD
MTGFDAVTPVLAGALTKRGYVELTDIQTAVLAPELAGRDFLASAQTGSGKTVAFGLAMAPEMLEDGERMPMAAVPLAVVVAPTRELAMQVCGELTWLYEGAGARMASCVGGMSIQRERRALMNGAHIVVGTPGRLCDHIRRGSLDMASVRVVVLDEADEMLDLGFREDLEFILGAAPETRRTLMFSATVPKAIAQLAKRFQRDAARISASSPDKQHADIEYGCMAVAGVERESAVINTLRFFEAPGALVFCSTREAVKTMAAHLGARGFSVVALSGELTQNERTSALQAMRDGRARVCVATDVASRGIDLPNLDLVIHADMPKSAETLLHRSGRTGRAGRSGLCVVIVPHSRRRSMERLLREASINASWKEPPSFEDILRKDRERLLTDSVFEGELSDEEQVFADELLAAHGPERIAAAILRRNRNGLPTPARLAGVGERPRVEADAGARSEDGGGVWFRLSAGAKHRADPRWLLPVICRAGGVSKRDVGAIRIGEAETLFEISAKSAGGYLAHLSENGTGEKSIVITPAGPGEAEAPRRGFKKGAAPFRKFRGRQAEAQGQSSNGAGHAPARREKRAAPAAAPQLAKGKKRAKRA